MVKCRRMKRPQFVKEKDILLTMKVLENTPTVLSLGKLCDENGCSFEWINGQKPHFTKTVFRYPATRKTSWLVIEFSPSLPSSTSTPSRQERNHFTLSPNSSTSTTTVSSNSETPKVREDLSGVDHPASLSSPHVDRKEWCDPLTKIQNQTKRKPRASTGRPVPFRHTRMAARIQRNSWMKVFLNTTTHTQVPFVECRKAHIQET